MRVLNIVTSECRLLSSRERCPYLVHLEVAETGLEGSDARLYASGAKGLGTTIEESLCMAASERLEVAVSVQDYPQSDLPFYKIPTELLSTPAASSDQDDTASTLNAARSVNEEFLSREDGTEKDSIPQSGEVRFPSRGGWQGDDGIFYPPESADYLFPNHFVREQQYEQLHQQMQSASHQPTRGIEEER